VCTCCGALKLCTYLAYLVSVSKQRIYRLCSLLTHSVWLTRAHLLFLFKMETPQRRLEQCGAARASEQRVWAPCACTLRKRFRSWTGSEDSHLCSGSSPGAQKHPMLGGISTVGVDTTRGLLCTPWDGARVPLHSHTHNQTRAADQNAPALSPQLHPSPVPRCAWRQRGAG
jgi:hypothetical protein